jgi:hypothetical protein
MKVRRPAGVAGLTQSPNAKAILPVVGRDSVRRDKQVVASAVPPFRDYTCDSAGERFQTAWLRCRVARCTLSLSLPGGGVTFTWGAERGERCVCFPSNHNNQIAL